MKAKQFIIYLLGIILTIGLLSNCNSDEATAKVRKDFMLGGIQVNSPDQHQLMSVMKDAGMNTVSITIYTRHYDWDKSFFTIDSSSFSNVIHEIKVAKANDMKVVFIPRILLDHYFDGNRFLWHGLIMPETDSLIQQWFTFYTDYLDQWAKVCEEHQVEVFAIGSEYKTFTQTQVTQQIPELESFYLNPKKQQEHIDDRMAYKDVIPTKTLSMGWEDVNYERLENYLKDEVTAHKKWANKVTYNGNIDKINHRRALLLEGWTTLIQRLRKSYSGKLTYAANFDNYQNIAFWDQLDFMGINAYFPLRKSIAPATTSQKYAEMESSWNRIFQDIRDFQKKNNIKIPLLFTELGYISKENCTLMPWQGSGFSIYKSNFKRDLILWDEQTTNFEERAAAIKALRTVNQQYDNILEGILYWKISTNSAHSELEPFLMLLDQDHVDPMQLELNKFTE